VESFVRRTLVVAVDPVLPEPYARQPLARELTIAWRPTGAERDDGGSNSAGDGSAGGGSGFRGRKAFDVLVFAHRVLIPGLDDDFFGSNARGGGGGAWG
jgi:hypothetical protein